MEQPMRSLNASSAKAGTWVVRVVVAEQDSFEYGSQSNRQRMYTFDCTLLSPDPTWYAQGTLKSPKREIIDAAKKKFLPDTLWRMSKVAFDNKAKPTFVSAPQKYVILMGPPTRFEPVLEGSAPCPRVPIPQADISNILKLKEQKKLYDVAGVLASGPTNLRTPNTKRGSRRAADFQLVQGNKNRPEEVHALDFTAWEGLIAQLEPLVGQYVSLFKLEVSLIAQGQVSCETSWGAFVAKLEPDNAMAAFIEMFNSGGSCGPVTVTTKWTPSEPAFDVTGPQPLVCASYLQHTEQSVQAIAKQTWQICAAFLDTPTSNILTQDGRLWFISTLRDLTGSIEVGVTEAAALKAAGVTSREEFVATFEAGALQFACCNVRGGRAVRDGEVRTTIMMCEQTKDLLPLTANARRLYDHFRLFGRTGGGVVATCLREMEADSFTGLLAAGLPVQKVLLLVKGLDRSNMEKLGDQRKMITPVSCILKGSEEGSETSHYKVVAFCHEDCVSDYKFDKGQALVLATSIAVVQDNPKEYEVLAESIRIVMHDDIKSTRDALQTQASIAQKMADGSTERPDMKWEDSPPNKGKRCRTIAACPSDP